MDDFTFGSTKACQRLARELTKCNNGVIRHVSKHIKRADLIVKKLYRQCGDDPEFFKYLYNILRKDFMIKVDNSNWPIIIKTLAKNVLNYKFKIMMKVHESAIKDKSFKLLEVS